MKTKFDIDENVFIKGHIKSIAVNENKEIGYKVIFKSVDGSHVLVFDEDEIVRDTSKDDVVRDTSKDDVL